MIRLQDASNSWKGPWLYTDEKGYNFLSKSRLFKDDILMSNVGTVGRFFQVPELDRPMTLAPNSVLIRSTSSNNQFFIFYDADSKYSRSNCYEEDTRCTRQNK